jgi:hypothetical protein
VSRVSSPITLVRVELVKANKTDVVALGGLKLAAEACAGIAAKHRVPGVESFNSEQIPRPAQAFDVAEVHDPVPFRLAQEENRGRAPSLGRSKHYDVNLDLGPVRRIRDDPGSHLAWHAAEYAGIGRDRVVAADRLEMRSCDLRQERPDNSLRGRAANIRGTREREFTHAETTCYPLRHGTAEAADENQRRIEAVFTKLAEAEPDNVPPGRRRQRARAGLAAA